MSCRSLDHDSLHSGVHGDLEGPRTLGCHPVQYDTGKSWPVLTAEVTPKLDTTDGPSRAGLAQNRPRWTWDESIALPAECLRGRHPLRDDLVQARMTSAACRSTPLLEIAKPACDRATHVMPSATPAYTTNLPSGTSRGAARGWCGSRRRSAASRTRRSGRDCSSRTSTLEERPNGSRVAFMDHDEPASGRTRLPRSWRSVDEQRYQGDDVPRVGPWRTRLSSTYVTRRLRVKTVAAPASRTTVHLRRPALRRPAHSSRRLRPNARTRSRRRRTTDHEIGAHCRSGYPTGEVSTFLHDELTVGGQGRGPRPDRRWSSGTEPRPRFSLAAVRIVPLMAMLRLCASHPAPDARPISCVRTHTRRPDHANQLEADDATVIYQPAKHRLTRHELSDDSRSRDLAPYLRPDAVNYIWRIERVSRTQPANTSSTPRVDTNTIRVERFGPTAERRARASKRGPGDPIRSRSGLAPPLGCQQFSSRPPI